MNARPRVVLDTNVWLSALVFGGKPRQDLLVLKSYEGIQILAPAAFLKADLTV
jgi:predicted nucleic acid-binding protein